jgi:hypothetical protein
LKDMASRSAALGSTSTTTSCYAEYVNPQWVDLLDILDMNVEYERCEGSELFTRDGRRMLDFLLPAFWIEALSLARRAAKI